MLRFRSVMVDFVELAVVLSWWCMKRTEKKVATVRLKKMFPTQFQFRTLKILLY